MDYSDKVSIVADIFISPYSVTAISSAIYGLVRQLKTVGKRLLESVFKAIVLQHKVAEVLLRNGYYCQKHDTFDILMQKGLTLK